MSARWLVDGRPAASVSPLDRGLLYGDGLFETVLCGRGRPTLWREHWRRLESGCRRLGIEPPEEPRLLREMRRLAADLPRAVLRITVTRGVAAARGEAAPTGRATRILCAWPEPAPDPERYRRGVRVRWCRLRLAERPELAGIKHLNRLELVLARREWRDPRIAEGLLRDAGDRLVCACAANVFLVRGGTLWTPALDRCGVAGTLRAFLLARLPTRIAAIPAAWVEEAEELFLTNAVRGVVPVRAVGRRSLPIGPVTRRAMALLHASEPLLQPPADEECR
ncbi:MAG: aminodeoxychorismate lyase [Xanthomonadales bacterium]|nr:aminodeoxychorismate lyase [Xanthomonadales bacterium]